MKKIVYILLLSATSFGFCSTMEELSANLNGSDKRAADNARMELEKLNAENELIIALGKTGDKNLREGIIYSLGKMRSEKAYAQIVSIAFQESDKSPAAVLALGEYKNDKSAADLKKLSEMGCKTANTALSMGEMPTEMIFKKTSFDKAGENKKVAMFGNCKYDKTFINFVLGYKAPNERLATAQSFALARIPFKDGKGAVKIADIASEYKSDSVNFAYALASASNPESVIMSLVCNKDPVGIAAAKLRNCSEAENALLKTYLESDDKDLKRLCVDALQCVASQKSADILLPNFFKTNKENLVGVVKILSSVYSRLDENAKKAMSNKLSCENKNVEDFYKAAANKIVSDKK